MMATVKSCLCRVWHELRVIFLSILFTVVIVPIFILVFIPIYIFRFVLAKSVPWIRPDLAKILSARSAIVANDDLTGTPTYTLLTAVTVEGNVDVDFVRQEVMRKVILSKANNSTMTKKRRPTTETKIIVHSNGCNLCTTNNENGGDCGCGDDGDGTKENLNYPEFQQYYEKWFHFKFWRWDTQFAIENHVNVMDPSEKSTSVNEIDVAKLRLVLVRKPFPPRRGLWELIIVKNFVPTTQNNEENGPKSVVILRVHHSLLDGYALLQVFMTQMMGGEKVSQSELPVPKPNFVRRHWLSSFVLHLSAVMVLPYTVVINLFEGQDQNPFHVSERQLMRKIFPAADKVAMSSIHEVRRVNGGVSFTSVILAMLSGGIRNFMLANDMTPPENMSLVMPLPSPGEHPSKLRNYWTFCQVKLPIGLAHPRERLEKCQKNWDGVRNSAKPAIIFALVPLIGGLTEGIMKCFVKNCLSLSTILLSNFPGPPQNAHFFGYPITDASFGGGMGHGNLGFGMALLSYEGFLRISIGIDQGILESQPRVQELMNFIRAELDILGQTTRDDQDVI